MSLREFLAKVFDIAVYSGFALFLLGMVRALPTEIKDRAVLRAWELAQNLAGKIFF